MHKAVGMFLLIVGFSSFALAIQPSPAPEINPGSAANALAILLGAGMMVRARFKK